MCIRDRDSTTYKAFAEYREGFGANEFIIVTWPGCDLDDPRLEDVTKRIQTDLPGLVKQVSSGQQAYRALRQRANLSEKTALNRLRNSFVSDSSHDTALGFNLTDAGRSDRGAVISQLHQILQVSGVDPATASYSGLAHNLYTLDKELSLIHI